MKWNSTHRVDMKLNSTGVEGRAYLDICPEFISRIRAVIKSFVWNVAILHTRFSGHNKLLCVYHFQIIIFVWQACIFPKTDGFLLSGCLGENLKGSGSFYRCHFKAWFKNHTFMKIIDVLSCFVDVKNVQKLSIKKYYTIFSFISKSSAPTN